MSQLLYTQSFDKYRAYRTCKQCSQQYVREVLTTKDDPIWAKDTRSKSLKSERCPECFHSSHYYCSACPDTRLTLKAVRSHFRITHIRENILEQCGLLIRCPYRTADGCGYKAVRGSQAMNMHVRSGHHDDDESRNVIKPEDEDSAGRDLNAVQKELEQWEADNGVVEVGGKLLNVMYKEFESARDVSEMVGDVAEAERVNISEGQPAEGAATAEEYDANVESDWEDATLLD